MKTLKELRARLASALDEMDDLMDAGLDDDSRAEFDSLEKEAETLRADIARTEKHEERKAWANEPAPDNPPRIVMDDAPADKGFPDFGSFLAAVRTAGSSGGRVDEHLLAETRVSGASEGVASDGGFLVGTDSEFRSLPTAMA